MSPLFNVKFSGLLQDLGYVSVPSLMSSFGCKVRNFCWFEKIKHLVLEQLLISHQKA